MDIKNLILIDSKKTGVKLEEKTWQYQTYAGERKTPEISGSHVLAGEYLRLSQLWSALVPRN
jgi:hypothetical protein